MNVGAIDDSAVGRQTIVPMRKKRINATSVGNERVGGTAEPGPR